MGQGKRLIKAAERSIIRAPHYNSAGLTHQNSIFRQKFTRTEFNPDIDFENKFVRKDRPAKC
jgi:hypothetical protein